MPIYNYFDTFTTAPYFVYYWNLSILDPVDIIGLSQFKKHQSSLNFLKT